MKKSNEEGLYTTTLYTQIAQAYAKNNCKHCYGRGMLNYISPEGEKYSNYCSCVQKNLKKQKLNF